MAGSPRFQKVWYLSAISPFETTDFKNRAEL